MPRLELKNRWVLVTGASSGLGAEMARQLANKHEANLILLARRADRLAALKDELEQTGVSRVEVLTGDLSDQSNYPELCQKICSLDVQAAVLNAGITYFDEDSRQEWTDFQTMQNTNVSAVVYFIKALGKYFDEQQRAGSILVVGSMAGLVPVPYQAAYSGTKAFLTHYCAAVQQEWSKKGYALSHFSPSGIDTEMNQKSGLGEYFTEGFALQSVESCAEDAINTMIHRKKLFVPRLSNRLQVLAIKLLPRSITIRVLGFIYRRAWLATKGRGR